MSARVLVAGTHSSVGKTTLTLGLIMALARRGLRIAPFKAGPDYIDPTLHALAAGRPSRNLDVWLLDEPALRGVLRRGMQAADIGVIEGVMGLFDGIGAGQDGSTAALARTTQSPVILVLDVAAMSGTAAALVLGCQRLQPGVSLAGVVLNRVGGDVHARATAEAIFAATGLPVLGSLPSDHAVALPERHLGLVPANERSLAHGVLDRLARIVEERFDLEAIIRIARSASALAAPPTTVPVEKRSARIAVAQDRAFGFYYQDTIDLLGECGAEVVPFSPLSDAALPEGTDGVYLGGGFPEQFAGELSSNDAMRRALQAHGASGRPIYAECGGLMALGQSLTTFDGERFEMFDMLPLASCMQNERLSIGYCEVEALRPSVLMDTGQRVRGHEFHWSVADSPPAELAAYRLVGSDRLEGFLSRTGSVLGSYVHLNLAGAPALAQRFVHACASVGAHG